MTGKILIKDLGSDNKPRERLVSKGAESLSDMELLALVLGSGGKNTSVLDLSAQLLKSFKNLKNLLEADLNQIQKHKHIGKAKSSTIKAVGEMAKRAYLSDTKTRKLIKKPEDVFKFIKKDLFGKKREHLFLISLDSRKRVISKDLICIGSINETLVPVREIIRKAILNNAVNLILVHNHPSNDPTPSREDILITEKVAKACEVSGMYLIDHVVTADGDYVSIKSLNLFRNNKLSNKRG